MSFMTKMALSQNGLLDGNEIKALMVTLEISRAARASCFKEN